jgi:hypothetical protein
VDLTGRQVLEPRPGRVGEVQGEVADDDLVISGSAQLSCQAVVVEPHAGIRLPLVLDDGRRLAEARGESRCADLPAQYAGPRGLRRWRAVFIAIVVSTPSGVVACCRSRIRFARPSSVDDVTGVAVPCLPARVEEPFFSRRVSRVSGALRRSTRVHRGFAPLRAPIAPRVPLLADAGR